MLDVPNSTDKSYADGKILQRSADGVGIITFNNPEKRNAMSLDMWEGLGLALTELRDDPEVRVVIMVGAGDKAFVSGADISQFEKTRHNAEASEEYSKKSAAQRALLADYPKPTVACIRGFCLGGGMQVAMLADIRIASDNSQFGIPAAKLGIAYGYDGLKHLVSLVGPSWARLIMYTGMRIDSAEALRIGLVDRVLPDAELWDATTEIARTISGNAPLAIQAAKITIAQVLKDPDKTRHGCDQGDRHRLHGQRGFPRGPPRLHGKAQAAIPRAVMAEIGIASDESAAVSVRRMAALRNAVNPTTLVALGLAAILIFLVGEPAVPAGQGQLYQSQRSQLYLRQLRHRIRPAALRAGADQFDAARRRRSYASPASSRCRWRGASRAPTCPGAISSM